MDTTLPVSKEREREVADAFLATGSPENFRSLFEALYPKLVRYFSLRGIDRLIAEELAQDVLMTVYQRSGALRERESFFGWLFKIAHNRLLQLLRQRQHDIETIPMEPSELNEYSPSVNPRVDVDGEFLEWMKLLEPVERQVIMLRYLEDLGYQEIAEALSIPLGTVKWKIFNGKERLMRALSTPGRGAKQAI
jgi:RNA polymerase sigma-70 factor (ECF subfamily)